MLFSSATSTNHGVLRKSLVRWLLKQLEYIFFMFIYSLTAALLVCTAVFTRRTGDHTITRILAICSIVSKLWLDGGIVDVVSMQDSANLEMPSIMRLDSLSFYIPCEQHSYNQPSGRCEYVQRQYAWSLKVAIRVIRGQIPLPQLARSRHTVLLNWHFQEHLDWASQLYTL